MERIPSSPPRVIQHDDSPDAFRMHGLDGIPYPTIPPHRNQLFTHNIFHRDTVKGHIIRLYSRPF